MVTIASIIACLFIVSVCIYIYGKHLVSAVMVDMMHRLFKDTFADQEKFKTEFRVRPDDVFVVGCARSGTTWTGHVVRLVIDCAHGISASSANTKSAPQIDIIPSAKPSEYWETLASPRLLKTHFSYDMMPGGLPHTHTAKYVYIARNPKDTVVSMHHFMAYAFQNVGMPRWPWWLSFELAKKGFRPFGHWHEHVLEWWLQRDRPNILFLKYEDMKKDLTGTIRKIADFLGYDHLGSDAIDKVALQCSFSTMKKDHTFTKKFERQVKDINLQKEVKMSERIFAPFIRFLLSFKSSQNDTENSGHIRKGSVGNWKNYFTLKQSKEADGFFRLRKLHDYGLQFDFE